MNEKSTTIKKIQQARARMTTQSSHPSKQIM